MTECRNCGAEVEVHYPNPRTQYAYWRHVVTQRRLCQDGEHFAGYPRPNERSAS